MTAVSTRERAHYGRRNTGFVTVPARAGVVHVLEWAHRGGADRVLIVGGRDTFGDDAEAVRAWFVAGELGEHYRPAGRGHYVADADKPVGRYECQCGHTFTVARAAAWFGEGDYTIAEARTAWANLRALIFAAWPGATLLDSPAATGADLWRRTIPAGGWPAQDAELRELIAATAGQGRIERLPTRRRTIPAFTYIDGRLMYAGLTWGMPVGPATWWTRRGVDALDDDARARLLRGRGRWRVRFSAPADWTHVGLLMAPAGRGQRAGWHYPTDGETWAGGAEVCLAIERGWRVDILEGVTWAEGKPLDVWTRRLVDVWRQLGTAGDRLGANAVRSMLLQTIGLFAARERTVTHVAATFTGDPAAVRGGIREVDGRAVWEEAAPLGPWQQAMAHPEWAAAIWARARVRLLSAPGGAGALSLPRRDVLAFRTDAIYVAAEPPAWPDDGRPGRFRVKGTLRGPLPCPRTDAELWALRDAAEAQGRED